MGTSCCNRPVVLERASTTNSSKNLVMIYSKNSDLRKNYEFISNLGSGAFGKVRLYRNKSYKDLKYAIKTLKKEGISKPLFDLILIPAIDSFMVLPLQVSFILKVSSECIK